MNKKGDMGSLMVGLLMAFIGITLVITLLPGFQTMIDYGKSSSTLNCKGYTDVTDASSSYNATIGEKSTIGCLALSLYIPYLLLGTLVAIVGGIIYNKAASQSQYPTYG